MTRSAGPLTAGKQLWVQLSLSWPSRVTAAELRQRRRILFAMLTVLDFGYQAGREPALVVGLRQWLGGWPGIGRIVAGMARQGYDLQLTRYGREGWRATFYPAGLAHSLTAAVASAWTREPWVAVQRAAWDGLRETGSRGGVIDAEG